MLFGQLTQNRAFFRSLFSPWGDAVGEILLLFPLFPQPVKALGFWAFLQGALALCTLRNRYLQLWS